MHRKWLIWSILIGSITLINGCVDPFRPPVADAGVGYLVIDGFLHAENGQVAITLSRTTDVYDGRDAIVYESSASVKLEVNGGTTYDLVSKGGGLYQRDGVFPTAGDQCRLLIDLQGKKYASAVVTARVTPEIDSVTYNAGANGVSIQVSTHDPQQKSWYYRWQFEETVEYVSAFNSRYIALPDGSYRPREQDEQIYRCWETFPSTSLMIGTSSGLSQDIIQKFHVTYIDGTSWKLWIKYSINVKQYAMERAEYEYLDALRKNTETIGTLFDPQPSVVTGNFTCTTDPSEPVLGYFSVRSIREKRIFITRGKDKLPAYDVVTGIESCFQTLGTVSVTELAKFPGIYILIDGLGDDGNFYAFSTHTNPSCVDCRVRGGVATKPDFWN